MEAGWGDAGLWTLRGAVEHLLRWRGMEGREVDSGMGPVLGRARGPPPPRSLPAPSPTADPVSGGPGGAGPCAPVPAPERGTRKGGGVPCPEAAGLPRPQSHVH